LFKIEKCYNQIKNNPSSGKPFFYRKAGFTPLETPSKDTRELVFSLDRLEK